MMITMNNKILIHSTNIQNSVEHIANIINNNHHKDDTIIMICVLNGAFMFFTDLTRRIKCNVVVDFIGVKSYDKKSQSNISYTKDISVDLNDKIVYLIDEIVDTGNTLSKIESDLNQRFLIKELKKVSLLKKDTSDLECIYGILLTNEKWLYGYGMDSTNGTHRNHLHIYGEEIETE